MAVAETKTKVQRPAIKRVEQPLEPKTDELSDFQKSVYELASHAKSGVFPSNASETKLRHFRTQED